MSTLYNLTYCQKVTYPIKKSPILLLAFLSEELVTFQISSSRIVKWIKVSEDFV